MIIMKSSRMKPVISGCMLMLFLGSIFSWSVFKKPLQQAFGWNDSELSWPFMICMICFTAGNILAAKLSKKCKHRYIIWMSGLIAFAGLFMASRCSAPWQLNISYGVCMGIAVGMSYNCIISSGGAWFADKPGTITGVTMMSFGCGSLIFAPLDNYLLATIGWSNTFLVLGVAFLLSALVCGCFISMPPADYVCPPPNKKSVETVGEDYSTDQMLRQPKFWLLLTWAIAGATVGYSVINQVFMIANSIGINDVASSLAVSLVSIANGISRVLSGKIADEKGIGWEMGMISVLLVLSMLCLIPAINHGMHWLLFVGMGLFGMGFGAISPTIANVVRSLYGSKYFAMNYSMLNFNSVGGSLISQIVSGYVLTVTGSYLSMMFCVCAVVAVIVLTNILVIRK